MNGYRVPCSGDSGSGQLVLTPMNQDAPKDSRYVLAAVFGSKTKGEFTDGGKTYSMPCGSYAIDESNPNEHKHVVLGSIATSTSWPEILQWIKNKAEI